MYFKILLVLFLLKQEIITAIICSRYPSNTNTTNTPVDENFAILINNNPQTYVPGQKYNISLNAFKGYRFISFILALENDNGVLNSIEDLGHFEITDTVETRFKPNCVSLVEKTNTQPKTHIELQWIAPTDPKSGCILIRATLLTHRNVWHMDDGGLTRRICPENTDEMENQRGLNSEKCCACDEARYELKFQGVWNRNLHPKDFPTKGWIARFGDIIGTAHTADYRFWLNDEIASDGMREYAEHGYLRTLEQEFSDNFNNGTIRTIIKSRGPSYPNLNGFSLASVRVDPNHHMISLVSKIDPSPDWFVGIAGLELCMENCTWLEERIIQLYPWDAGTDSGPSYMSSDEPQLPVDVIRRVRTNISESRSPFDAEMSPFATLTVKRQRVYERSCEDPDSNNDNIPRECYTHPWTEWSECTARCGEGRSFRSRVYKQKQLAQIYNCDEMIELNQIRRCRGENCIGFEAQLNAESYDNQENLSKCRLTEFGPWSECSKTCGEGITKRRRQYINVRSQEACETYGEFKLLETAKCHGVQCLGDLNNEEAEPNVAEGEYWSTAVNQPERSQNSNYGNIGNRNYHQDNQQWNNNVGNNFGSNYYNNDRQSIGMNVNNDNQQWNNNDGNNFGTNYYKNDRQSIGMNVNNDNQQWNNNDGNNFGTNYYKNDRQSIGMNVNNDNNIYKDERYDQTDNNVEEIEVGNLRKIVENNNFRRPNNYNENNYQQNKWNSGGGRRNSKFSQSSGNSFSNLYQQIEEEIPRLLAPSLCFEKIKIFPCLDTNVVGNFWFYNYCEDQCMLFAVDSCDCNRNKFKSLEECELQCSRPENEPYLKYQQLQNCKRKEQKRKKNVKRWQRN